MASGTNYPGSKDSWANVTTTLTATNVNERTSAVEQLERSIDKIVKLSSESVSNSTTLQDDDELLLAIPANEKCRIRLYLRYDGPASNALKFGLALSGAVGGTNFLLVHKLPSSGTITTDAGTFSTRQAGGSYTADSVGVGTIETVYLDGSVQFSSNGGEIKLQWAQNASSGTATTVFFGSTLLKERVP